MPSPPCLIINEFVSSGDASITSLPRALGLLPGIPGRDVAEVVTLAVEEYKAASSHQTVFFLERVFAAPALNALV